MTTFEDWNVEYDPNIYTNALALKGQATIRAMTVAKAFVPEIDILGTWENGIRESVRRGIELTPDQLRKLLLTDPQKQRALAATGRQGEKLVDAEIKKIWASAEKTVAAANIAEELARSEAEYTASRRAFGAATPEVQMSAAGQQMLERANKQEKTNKVLREQNNKAQDERWDADKAFLVEAGMVSGEAQAAQQQLQSADVRAKRIAEQRRDERALQGDVAWDVVPGADRAAGVYEPSAGFGFEDIGRRYQEAQRQAAGTPASLEGTEFDPEASRFYMPPVTPETVTPPGTVTPDQAAGATGAGGITGLRAAAIRKKWSDAGLSAIFTKRMDEEFVPLEQLDQEIDKYIREASAAGQTVSEYYQSTYMRPGRLDQRTAPGLDGVGVTAPDQDAAAKNALRERLAAGMPGARELAFQQQADPTVWSRLGLMGELASDPYTGEPISTAQLSGLGKQGIEDWYYRTVQPRYGFDVAQAAQQRALGVTPEFKTGFEAFASKAPTRGRITPEEALRGQQAVIAALQAPRDVQNPFSQELFSYIEETGGVDAPQNERLLAMLAAPMISEISPRYRRPATARLQQELINRMVTQPEQQMLSFFTGKPAVRPEYQPGTFEALAGGQPPVLGG